MSIPFVISVCMLEQKKAAIMSTDSNESISSMEDRPRLSSPGPPGMGHAWPLACLLVGLSHSSQWRWWVPQPEPPGHLSLRMPAFTLGCHQQNTETRETGPNVSFQRGLGSGTDALSGDMSPGPSH